MTKFGSQRLKILPELPPADKEIDCDSTAPPETASPNENNQPSEISKNEQTNLTSENEFDESSDEFVDLEKPTVSMNEKMAESDDPKAPSTPPPNGRTSIIDVENLANCTQSVKLENENKRKIKSEEKVNYDTYPKSLIDQNVITISTDGSADENLDSESSDSDDQRLIVRKKRKSMPFALDSDRSSDESPTSSDAEFAEPEAMETEWGDFYRNMHRQDEEEKDLEFLDR